MIAQQLASPQGNQNNSQRDSAAEAETQAEQHKIAKIQHFNNPFQQCGIIQHMGEPAAAAQKRAKRSYTNEEVANALIAVKSLGGNIYKAAAHLKIPYHTLREWAANKRRDSEEMREIQHNTEKAQKPAITMYQDLEILLLNRAIEPEVIAQMKGLDLAKAASLTRGTIQLLTGQPTSINEERGIDSHQVLVLIRESCGIDAAPPERNVTPAPAQLIP
jgi:hypothetical protein